MKTGSWEVEYHVSDEEEAGATVGHGAIPDTYSIPLGERFSILCEVGDMVFEWDMFQFSIVEAAAPSCSQKVTSASHGASIVPTYVIITELIIAYLDWGFLK